MSLTLTAFLEHEINFQTRQSIVEYKGDSTQQMFAEMTIIIAASVCFYRIVQCVGLISF